MANQLDPASAQFLKLAVNRGHRINDVVWVPDVFAKKLGVKLTQAQRSTIQRLSSPAVTDRFTSLSPAARHFMRDVINDGRYLADWKDDPIAVGKRLGTTIDPVVADEIRQIKLSDIISPKLPTTQLRVGAATVISVAVAVIVTASGLEKEEFPIIDFSKIQKL